MNTCKRSRSNLSTKQKKNSAKKTVQVQENEKMRKPEEITLHAYQAVLCPAYLFDNVRCESFPTFARVRCGSVRTNSQCCVEKQNALFLFSKKKRDEEDRRNKNGEDYAMRCESEKWCALCM